MSQPKVLIVGASIAGPTAAYWLAKAGCSVTVIERFPSLRKNGQNVDIRTSGVSVMRKMVGMEAAVRAKTSPLQGINFVHSDGRTFATIRPTGNPDQQSLVSEFEIFRGDLAQILYDMTKDSPRIRYVFGEQVASMRQDREDGAITVEFLNGSLPTSEYDLVVACDGATSRTRGIGLGCGARDYVEPVNSWAAYFSIPRDLLHGSKMGQSYSAVGGRFIALGPDPSGHGSQVVLMGLHPQNDRHAMDEFRRAVKEGDGSVKAFVARHYTGAGWKTDDIIEGMMASDDFYANEIVQIKPPALHRGRFVLVGDAGYATGPTGTGTTLAMTGAYVLAGEISKHKGDLAAGLEGYEDTMRPIIRDMQTIPAFVPAFLAPQTGWGLRVRNVMLAFVAWSRVLEFAQRYSAAGFGRVQEYALPEYEWAE